MKMPQEALSTFESALATRVKSLGPDHDETGKTILQLAIAQGLAGHIPEAIDLCTRGIRTMERALGPDRPEVKDGFRRFALPGINGAAPPRA
jgi:hypothetical protein